MKSGSSVLNDNDTLFLLSIQGYSLSSLTQTQMLFCVISVDVFTKVTSDVSHLNKLDTILHV